MSAWGSGTGLRFLNRRKSGEVQDRPEFRSGSAKCSRDFEKPCKKKKQKTKNSWRFFTYQDYFSHLGILPSLRRQLHNLFWGILSVSPVKFILQTNRDLVLILLSDMRPMFPMLCFVRESRIPHVVVRSASENKCDALWRYIEVNYVRSCTCESISSPGAEQDWWEQILNTGHSEVSDSPFHLQSCKEHQNCHFFTFWTGFVQTTKHRGPKKALIFHSYQKKLVRQSKCTSS